jgi:hypothetical protein
MLAVSIMLAHLGVGFFINVGASYVSSSHSRHNMYSSVWVGGRLIFCLGFGLCRCVFDKSPIKGASQRGERGAISSRKRPTRGAPKWSARGAGACATHIRELISPHLWRTMMCTTRLPSTCGAL